MTRVLIIAVPNQKSGSVAEDFVDLTTYVENRINSNLFNHNS